MTETQACMFDVGNVLGKSKATWRDRIQAEFGLPHTTWRPLLVQTENTFAGRRFAVGDMESALTGLLEPLLGDRASAAARAMLATFHDPAVSEDILAVRALASELHRAGVRTGVLSNSPIGNPRLASLRASGDFDAFVVSGEEGVGKPHPQAFALILERLGTEARNTWFVDDHAGHVEAGRACGLNALRFDGEVPVLRARLRETGLRW